MKEAKWFVEGYQTGRIVFEGTKEECDFFLDSDPYGWEIVSVAETVHTIYVN